MYKFRIENYDPNVKIYDNAVLTTSKFSTQARRTLMDMASSNDIHDQESLLDLSLISLVNVIRECELKYSNDYQAILLDRGLLSAWVYRLGAPFDHFLERLKVFRVDSERTLEDFCHSAYHLICRPEKLASKAINAYDSLDQSEIGERYQMFIDADQFNTFLISNEPILNKSDNETDFPDPVSLGSLIYKHL